MKDEIRERLDTNLARARNLVALYTAQAKGRGRREVTDSDLLRAAIVLLHATFEDVVRSVLEWKLPSAPANKLADLPLGGVATDRPGPLKFTLSELAQHHPGKTVEQIVSLSVSQSLLRSSYNNPGELDRAMDLVGLSGAWLSPHKQELEPMMRRRHWIAHRADRNESRGAGHHAALSIRKSTVETWIAAVDAFATALLSKC
jgi:hypothetical protein